MAIIQKMEHIEAEDDVDGVVVDVEVARFDVLQQAVEVAEALEPREEDGVLVDSPAKRGGGCAIS